LEDSWSLNLKLEVFIKFLLFIFWEKERHESRIVMKCIIATKVFDQHAQLCLTVKKIKSC
jgi:hypothetical protein